MKKLFALAALSGLGLFALGCEPAAEKAPTSVETTEPAAADATTPPATDAPAADAPATDAPATDVPPAGDAPAADATAPAADATTPVEPAPEVGTEPAPEAK